MTRPDDATRGPEHQDHHDQAQRQVDKEHDEALQPAADPDLDPAADPEREPGAGGPGESD